MICAAVLACLVGHGVAFADPPSRYSFREFGGEQGLGNHSINTVTQTVDGLLWVGTEDGLYRYDGHDFYRLDVTNGLLANEVLALLPVGRSLWVGTVRGLVHVDGVHMDRIALGVPFDHVNALARGPDGGVWAATDLGLYTEIGGVFVPAPGWPGGASAAVSVADDGRVIAGRDRGVAVLAEGTWTIIPAVDRERIDAIARTRDGTVWLRSSRFLWACDARATSCRDVSSELPDVSDAGRLAVDHAGELWVTTRQGLAHRTAGGWSVLGRAQGLPVRSVYLAFEDREGSLWFVADRLYQLLGRSRWRGWPPGDDFPADTVWSVLRDHAGALWLGSNHGVATARGDAWETFPGTEPYTVKALLDAGPVLYAGSQQSQLMQLDPATRTTTLIGELPGDGIQSLVLHGGSLWVGTWNGGLWRFHADGARWTGARVDVPGGDAREDFNQLVEDGAGRLWAAGGAGLAVLDGTTWRRFTSADGLLDNTVDYALVRRSGEMCVSYDEGHGASCFRYDGHLAALHSYTRQNGLTTGNIYSLGEDAAGRLYLGTGIGVDVIDVNGAAEIRHFSSATGMIGDDCAARAFWADPDGTVLFGTTHGLARFDSTRMTEPPPSVTPLVLGSERVGRTLVIRFATPTFENRARLEQQVRLVPLEAQWRDATSGEARYQDLAPGDYRFEMRARLAAGQLATTELAFTVDPTWWQTLWFRIAVALAALGSVAALIRWRVRVMSAHAAERIEASFRALIEQAPDAVFVVRDGRVIYANPRTVALLGGSPVGRPVLELVQPEVQGRFAHLLATADLVDELPMIGAGDKPVVIEVSALVVDFGGAPATLLTGRDHTEHKSLEARLMFTDRMASIGTLAAGIAHEVNNPLAYLKANLNLIAEELEGHGKSPALRAAIEDALDGAQRVETIVQGVKTFSRAEGEQRTSVDVHRALDAALRMTSGELRHLCTVTTNHGPVPRVLGNEARLGQVFINLLLNAAQADAKQIDVATRTRDDGRAEIEIRDDGSGMTAEVQRRIFEPFFTTKDVGKGTGLGLAVCHGIVQSLGGEISVDSAPGAGSTFRIVLPPTTEVARVSLKLATGPLAALRRLVLVIDDDEKLLSSIGRMLKKEHEVTLVASAGDALALIEGGAHYDVVLCDLMMPRYTGMQLHAELAAKHPPLAARMLFMTGGAFTAEAREFLDGGVRWIEKPFEPAELRKRIHAVARAAAA